MRNNTNVLSRVSLIGVLIASIFFLQILPGHAAFDDAYITYRYARNLAAGQGFTYNPGERVLGTTTPLYTILLAAISALFSIGDYPTLSIIINSIADIISILLVFSIISGLKYPKWLAIATAFAYLLNPVRVGVSRGGMETSLVIALILGSLYTYTVRSDTKAAAILSGFAFLARPDTLILPLLFAAYHVFQRRKFPLQEFLLFLIILGPWIIFSGVYFGNPIPNSIAAKANVYLLHPLQATTTILGYMATRSPIESLHWPLWAIGISLLINIWLFAIGSISLIRKSKHSTPMVLFPLLYMAGLMVANPLIFIWYLQPFIVFHISFIIIGLFTVFKRVRPTILAGGLSTFLCLLVWFEWGALGQPKDGLSVNLRDHEALYEYVAESFGNQIPAGSSLALPEIGVLGYSFHESRILDTVGIVSPEAIKYQYRSLQKGQLFSYAIPADLILNLQPDFLLTLDLFLLPDLVESEAFLDQYQLVVTIPTNAMGSTSFNMYKLMLSEDK